MKIDDNVNVKPTADVLIGKYVIIRTGTVWYMRLWFLISNPFRYLITGRLMY